MEASRQAPKRRTTAASPSPGPAKAPPAGETAGAEEPVAGEAGDRATSFLERATLRRRLRYLRRRRTLALRDLGGFVYEGNRDGAQPGAALDGRLAELRDIDGECDRLERALGERRELAVLREPGITVCASCATVHGSEDRFCPQCAAPAARRARRSTPAAN
jgi:hypothetical protein